MGAQSVIVIVAAVAWAVGCSSGTGTAGSGGSAGKGGGGGSGNAGGSGGGSGGSSNQPSCAELCPNVMAAQCSQGPPTLSDCVSGCEQVRSGPCAKQWIVLAECAGASPSYGCDANGVVSVIGCESQNEALNGCLGGA